MSTAEQLSTSSYQQPSSDDLLSAVKAIIPPLAADKHKGQCGRVAVIGGCQEYTGAPYFAAISALKVGADLSHVFCSTAAAPVIKSYSPDLIVHPTLDSSSSRTLVGDWLARMNAVAIGPGLGRDKDLLASVQVILEDVCKNPKQPLIIDADGLFLLSSQPHIVQDKTQVILTPNVAEFNRLYEILVPSPDGCRDERTDIEQAVAVSLSLGGVTVVRKGPKDIISNGKHGLILH